jgi:hypothetical protein
LGGWAEWSHKPNKHRKAWKLVRASGWERPGSSVGHIHRMGCGMCGGRGVVVSRRSEGLLHAWPKRRAGRSGALLLLWTDPMSARGWGGVAWLGGIGRRALASLSAGAASKHILRAPRMPNITIQHGVLTQQHEKHGRRGGAEAMSDCDGCASPPSRGNVSPPARSSILEGLCAPSDQQLVRRTRRAASGLCASPLPHVATSSFSTHPTFFGHSSPRITRTL